MRGQHKKPEDWLAKVIKSFIQEMILNDEEGITLVVFRNSILRYHGQNRECK